MVAVKPKHFSHQKANMFQNVNNNVAKPNNVKGTYSRERYEDMPGI